MRGCATAAARFGCSGCSGCSDGREVPETFGAAVADADSALRTVTRQRNMPNTWLHSAALQRKSSRLRKLRGLTLRHHVCMHGGAPGGQHTTRSDPHLAPF